MTYTLLSEDRDTITRLTVQPHNTTLQRFTREGVQEIALDDTELRALLAVLALGEKIRASQAADADALTLDLDA